MFSALNVIIDDSQFSLKTKIELLKLTIRQQPTLCPSGASSSQNKTSWESGLISRMKTCLISTDAVLRQEGLSLLNTLLSSSLGHDLNMSLCQSHSLFWLRSCLSILESKKTLLTASIIDLCLICISDILRLPLVSSDVDEMSRQLALPLIDQLLRLKLSSSILVSTLADAIKLFPGVAFKVKHQIEQKILEQVSVSSDEMHLQTLARCLSQLFANNLRSETIIRAIATLEHLLSSGLQLENKSMNNNNNNSSSGDSSRQDPSLIFSFFDKEDNNEGSSKSHTYLFTSCLTFISRVKFTSAMIVDLLSQSCSTLHVHVIPISRVMSLVVEMISRSNSSTSSSSLDSSLQSMTIPVIAENGLHILEALLVSCKSSCILHASSINSLLMQSLVPDDKCLRLKVYQLVQTWTSIGGVTCGLNEKQVDTFISKVIVDLSSSNVEKVVKLKVTSNKKGKKKGSVNNNVANNEDTNQTNHQDCMQLSVHALKALRSILSSTPTLTRLQMENLQSSLLHLLLTIYVDPECPNMTRDADTRLELLHVLRTLLFHPSCIHGQIQALEPSLLVFSHAERIEKSPIVKEFAQESVLLMMRAFVHPKMVKIHSNSKTDQVIEDVNEKEDVDVDQEEEEKVIELSSGDENEEKNKCCVESSVIEDNNLPSEEVEEQVLEQKHESMKRKDVSKDELNEVDSQSSSVAKKLKEDDKLGEMFNDFVDE